MDKGQEVCVLTTCPYVHIYVCVCVCVWSSVNSVQAPANKGLMKCHGERWLEGTVHAHRCET